MQSFSQGDEISPLADADSFTLRNVGPAGGKDCSEGGTEFLPFSLSALQGAEAARVGFGSGGGHGAGGVEEVAEGEESLGGRTRAVQLDLAADAPFEVLRVGRVHARIIPVPTRARTVTEVTVPVSIHIVMVYFGGSLALSQGIIFRSRLPVVSTGWLRSCW